jgi:acyl-CoA hydrolase
VTTERFDNLDQALVRIVARLGRRWVIAAPLGLGKPNRLLNALYRHAKAHAEIELQLFTALSLTRPQPRPGLESRFAGPFLQRHFGADYPDLDYLADRRAQKLPRNVRVREFYFQSGGLLRNASAQADYTSINYTHVAREVAAQGVNLIVQLVARRGDRLSLSCNSDVTLDLLDRLAREGRTRPLVVAVVHPALPFLGNDAEVPLDFADILIEDAQEPPALFALPREPVRLAEYALGLHASSLVRDGGTLQIGIGALSDALVHALLLRQRDNARYGACLHALRAGEVPEVALHWGGETPFARGLYGASEMVMDGFMHLRRAGILQRRVYDDLALQSLLNRARIGETADAQTLDRLLEEGLVPTTLDVPSVDWLMRYGLLPEGAQLHDGVLRLPDGTRVSANLLDRGARNELAQAICGRALRGGRYLHGAFYLGSRELYAWLGALQGEDYDGLCMTRVSHINELYGGRELLDIAQRHDARFFNTCMMHTLLGAAVSDALSDGQVVSGVGGQYNFVAMAHALPNGRSALMLRATREDGAGHVASNILWSYGHTTIPRHLRDLVVTEYGIADLRGASDRECIERMLSISDARFLDALAEQARRAGKLPADWRVPDAFRRNTPAFLETALAPARACGALPTYPFGSDFDAQELRLIAVLGWLKRATRTRAGKLATVARSLFAGAPDAMQTSLLARLGLDRPGNLAERIEARLVCMAIRRSGA